jgi:GTP pyrophosphokinase
VQRKLEGLGAAYSQGNIETLLAYYKFNSHLDFFYQVSVKGIDLKELKDSRF